MRQYSAEEAARFCGKSSRAIRHWIKLGHLRAARYGREFVIAAGDLPTTARRRRALSRSLLERGRQAS